MNAEEKIRYKARLWIFYSFIGVIMLTLLSGLAYRQLIEVDKFNERGKRQNHRRIITPGPRGNIFDREGRVLVTNKPKFSAVVFLADASVRKAFRTQYINLVKSHREKGEKFKDGETQTQARAQVIQSYLDGINKMLGRDDVVEPDRLARHFYINPLLPYHIIDNLSQDEFAILLESLPVESPIQVYVSNTRHYPFESAAAHTLGYVANKFLEIDKELRGSDLITFDTKGALGTDGIEKQYNSLLQGKPGTEIWVVDPAGFQVERTEREYPQKGNDLHLSLDIDLQLIAEAGFDQYEDEGALIALDIKTMEVLALVSKPDYNLNNTSPYITHKTAKDISDRGAWMNNATQGLYPPGSPFKLLTAVAGLKSGAINHETTHECTGHIKLGKATAPCWNRAGHGELNLQQAIRSSCNVFFYKSALDMGIDAISREAIYIGLDKRTQIDLPGETGRMLVPTKEWKKKRYNDAWRKGDTTNTSIGQGYLFLTPLQIATMTASISRNEVLTMPRIVKQSQAELSRRPKPKPLGLTPADHRLILDGMEKAVIEEGGTAKHSLVPGVRVGGKTGTAQQRVKGGTKEFAWVVAIAPIDDPQIAIAIVVEPYKIGSHGGGAFAAPIAQPVLAEYFRKNPIDSETGSTIVGAALP